MLRLMNSMLSTLRKREKSQSAKTSEAIPASPELIALKPDLGAGQSPSSRLTDLPKSGVEDALRGPDPALADAARSTPTRHDVAVLSLSDSGEILSARGSCMAVFGWDCSALGGKSIGLLLKGGLDNGVGKFLDQRQKGTKTTETVVLRVNVVRKDGGEFPASVTTPTWSLGTRLTQTSDTSHLGWTLAFRSVADSTDKDASPAAQTSNPTAPTQNQPGGERQANSSAESLSPVAGACVPERSTQPAGETTISGKTSAARAREEPPTRRQKAGEDWFDSDGLHAARRPEEKAPSLPGQAQFMPSNRTPAAAPLPAGESPEKVWFQRQVVEESNRRIEELQSRLSQKCAELERLKADLAKQKTDGEQAESEWRRELDTVAKAMGGKLQTAATGWQEREKQSKDDLAAMRQERDALKQSLEAEQKLACEARQRLQETENRLRQAACDQDSAKAETGRHLEERSRLEFELRAQLDAAKEAGGYTEAALREATLQREKLDQSNRELRHEQIELTKRFEESMARLRAESEGLRSKLGTEHGASAEIRRRVKEAESLLTRSTAELANVKGDFERFRGETERAESEWRKRLELAQARGEGQNKNIEEQLDSLRRERDQIQARLEAEQQATVEAKKRCTEVENQLRGAAAALEKLKDEAGHRSTAQRSSESKLRVELADMTAASTLAKAELKEAIERREEFERVATELRSQQAEREQRFEGELAALRKSSEELREKLTVEQQALVESGRRVEEMENSRSRSAAESERIKAELQQVLAGRGQAEADWRRQMEEVGAQKSKIEAACDEATELVSRMESDLNDLRQERDDLSRKVEAEQLVAAESKRRIEDLRLRLHQATSELEQAKGDSNEQQAQRQKSESQWQRQLAVVNARLQKAEAALAVTLEREKAVAEDAAKLRQERDELDDRLADEHRTTTESSRRAEAVERRLAQTAEELARVQAALDEQSLEGERMQAEWQQELSTARVRKEKAEMAWAESAEQNKRLEEELTGIRQEWNELKDKLTDEQHSIAESARRAEATEHRLTQNTEELERTKAELDKQAEEHECAESEWREQLAASKALTRKLETAWAGAAERSKRVEDELSTLRKEVEELGGKLTAEQLAASELRRRAESSERRARQYALELERARTAGGASPSELGRAMKDHSSQRSPIKAPTKSTATEVTSKLSERRDSPRGSSYSSPTTLFERYNLQP
jgi:chromosome segregation ATPase